MNQRKLATPDIVIAAAGLVALISTFLPWWKLSYSISDSASFSGTVNAWNSPSGGGDPGQTYTGPLAWIPMLLLLVLGILAFRSLFAPQLLAGKLFSQVGIGVGALSVILVIVRWLTFYKPPTTVDGVTLNASSGADYGLYIGLLAGLAVVGVSIWAMQQAPAAPSAPAFGGYPGQQPFGQPQYGQQPYGQPQQPPYPQQQPQYGQPQPQYPQPQAQYGQPPQQQAYGQQPQYPQPQPQYPQQPQYGQPQYGQPPQQAYGQPPQQQPQYPQPPQQWG